MVPKVGYRSFQTAGSGSEAAAGRFRWRGIAILIVLGLALVTGLIGPGAVTRAQESTPAPEASGALAGVTIEPLGSGMPEAATGRALSLLRVTLAPGASIPPHTQPGAILVVVESGAFGFTLTEGEGQLSRGAGMGTPSAAASLTPGEEVILNPGDAVFHDQDGWHTGRNAGDEPVVLLIGTLFDPDQPAFIFEEGTPTA